MHSEILHSSWRPHGPDPSWRSWVADSDTDDLYWYLHRLPSCRATYLLDRLHEEERRVHYEISRLHPQRAQGMKATRCGAALGPSSACVHAA